MVHGAWCLLLVACYSLLTTATATAAAVTDQNNCGCPEHEEKRINYEGDIRQLLALGFDGAKYDRCGVMLNSTLYAELMNATGKAFLIENCHWGMCDDGDDSSCPSAAPTRAWAPFNFFRTSGDVRETWNSVVRNALTATRFLDAESPLSGPHAWYGSCCCCCC